MLLINAIAIGMVLNFLCYELLGVVAGGIVTPGYFALVWDRPILMLTTILWALCTMYIVRFLSSYMILFGRRKFMLTILLGFGCQWTSSILAYGFTMSAYNMDGIAYIVPGILAHEMDRQGVSNTLLALLVVSACVRILLNLLT